MVLRAWYEPATYVAKVTQGLSSINKYRFIVHSLTFHNKKFKDDVQ